MKNCLSSERTPSFYLFIRRVIQQTVVIIEAYHFFSTVYKIIFHIRLLKVNSICTGNSWGPSVWILTQ